ncbi:hypothetical protein Srubr_22600 [Streptomyces rubradiris]|uniref:DoxX-like protein n=1 Tax=Streptomyces rubradiris TaxID=285531 RepID=A0ABQ3R981_STRRR|nr:hypothetical protein GCM10018792_13150 [Streptomyces rubradiris]GHI52414.1 hypothetical protein Srubr_22600 [Streptomyces rubradiris]
MIAGLSEFHGGLGLAVGPFTPLSAAALVGVMIDAMATVTGAHGLWGSDGGVEYNVGIAVVALTVAGTGPGRLALGRYLPGAPVAGPQQASPWYWEASAPRSH